MNKIPNRYGRLILGITAVISLQACSTFRTCANIVNSDIYINESGYKAVASYFDPATGNLPADEVTRNDECWYQTRSASQELANDQVLEACNEGLSAEPKAGGWECKLIAQGMELTDEESQRIAEWRNRRFIGTSDYGPMLSGREGGSFPPDPDKIRSKGL